jgi:hypothetical protein
MTTGTILLWALAGAVALVAVFFVWKLWSSRRADKQYAQGKATADTAVHHALQGKSFSVGTASDFIEGDLRGHFRWLSAERAWGLRLENPRASLRSLEGMSFPLWVRQGGEELWARHPEGSLRLRAYNTDVSLVLPKGLKDGDQIRLGDNAEDRAGLAEAVATKSVHVGSERTDREGAALSMFGDAGPKRGSG